MPSTSRAISSRTGTGRRASSETAAYSEAGRLVAGGADRGLSGRGGPTAARARCRLRFETIERPSASACSSSSASWSATPERRVWTSAPPSSSGVTSSPVAAFTSGGPPRKIVPGPADDHGLVAHRRHVRAAGRARAHHQRHLRDPGGRHPRLVVEDPAEVIAVREDLGLERQERAARVDEVDARQPVLERDLLGPQVLLDRHRVVGAALDRGVVGDDHAGRPLDATDAR